MLADSLLRMQVTPRLRAVPPVASSGRATLQLFKAGQCVCCSDPSPPGNRIERQPRRISQSMFWEKLVLVSLRIPQRVILCPFTACTPWRRRCDNVGRKPVTIGIPHPVIPRSILSTSTRLQPPSRPVPALRHTRLPAHWWPLARAGASPFDQAGQSQTWRSLT